MSPFIIHLLGVKANSQIPSDKIKFLPEISLHSYLGNRQLVNLFRHLDIDQKQIRQAVSISDIVKSTAADPDAEDQLTARKISRQATHELDVMVTIDAGCCDMAGNVWEWTNSWFDSDKDRRVLRGGAWFDARDNARCAYRYWNYPDGRNNGVGFRCART